MSIYDPPPLDLGDIAAALAVPPPPELAFAVVEVEPDEISVARVIAIHTRTPRYGADPTITMLVSRTVNDDPAHDEWLPPDIASPGPGDCRVVSMHCTVAAATEAADRAAASRDRLAKLTATP